MSEQDTGRSPADSEQAEPFEEDKTAKAEPQEARGAPGSRDKGTDESAAARPEEKATARDATGVNPLDPIDEDMPYLQPGDQGG